MEEPPIVHDCRRCPSLVESRSQIVNGRGDLDAPLIMIGEAPGRFEDEQGVPFVGRSGAILEETLLDFEVDPSSIRITNCVRCRPPENRNPRSAERSNCREYLDREIEFVDPRVVMPLGRVPSQELLGRQVAVLDEAGDEIEVEVGGKMRTLVVGLHPAATLYNRSQTTTFVAAIERALERAGLY